MKSWVGLAFTSMSYSKIFFASGRCFQVDAAGLNATVLLIHSKCLEIDHSALVCASSQWHRRDVSASKGILQLVKVCLLNLWRILDWNRASAFAHERLDIASIWMIIQSFDVDGALYSKRFSVLVLLKFLSKLWCTIQSLRRTLWAYSRTIPSLK